MAPEPGTYTFGPDNGTLSVKTGRTGAAAKAGHDLLIDVTGWKATLVVGAPTSIVLEADAASLQVREGTGGMQSLDDDDKAGIAQTIDEEVLQKRQIAFRSTAADLNGDTLRVQGDLTLGDVIRPISFELAVIDGRVGGSAVVKQSDWGISPYSTLFGTLKVTDEVTVAVDAALPAQSL